MALMPAVVVIVITYFIITFTSLLLQNYCIYVKITLYEFYLHSYYTDKILEYFTFIKKVEFRFYL